MISVLSVMVSAETLNVGKWCKIIETGRVRTGRKMNRRSRIIQTCTGRKFLIFVDCQSFKWLRRFPVMKTVSKMCIYNYILYSVVINKMEFVYT